MKKHNRMTVADLRALRGKRQMTMLFVETPDEAAAHARKRHTDERPYGCDVCHAAFAAAISLTAHKRTHAVPRV